METGHSLIIAVCLWGVMQRSVLESLDSYPLADIPRGASERMITAIIPLRLSTHRLYDEIERLKRIAETIPRDLYKILIVDYGTPSERCGEIAQISEIYRHVKVLRVEASEPFSIGRARDIGVQNAKTNIILFHDIDLIGSPEAYQRIHDESQYRRLAERGYDFFCVPAIFLSGAGSQKYLARFGDGRAGPAAADREAFDDAIRGAKEFVDYYSTAMSSIVINRYYYLTTGGHDPAFIGHGAEDFEFFHRVESVAPRAPRPPRYYENLKGQGYNGFRSYFALFGMDVWMRGIALFHLHHPRREQFDDSYQRSASNFAMLPKKMKEFDEGIVQRPPIPDLSVTESTLVLTSEGSLPGRSLRGALPALGNYEFLPESAFLDSSRLLRFICERGITQVLFLTPYGNPFRLSLYRDLRSAGVRTIAYDRGALPDSWFFDRDGFLGESASYGPSRWDHPLAPERAQLTAKWISEFRSSAETLEENGPRQGPDYWRSVMNLGRRRVILVVFQRPSDVATRWFGGPVGSSDTFTEWIEIAAAQLDQTEYVMVAKKHPLEKDRASVKGVIYARDDANIYDLIDLADKVVTINSGVGLLCLLFDKPSITCGQAFYQHPGLAIQASFVGELIRLVHQDIKVDKEKVRRFVAYLKNDFYSFGSSHYRNDIAADGSKRRRVHRIDFSRIANLTIDPIVLGKPRTPLRDDCFLLSVAGYKRISSGGKLGLVAATARTPFPNWGLMKRSAHWIARLVLHPALGLEDRRRLALNPIDFFKKAKWPPNRFFGRLLLDQSQRPY